MMTILVALLCFDAFGLGIGIGIFWAGAATRPRTPMAVSEDQAQS